MGERIASVSSAVELPRVNPMSDTARERLDAFRALRAEMGLEYALYGHA